MSHFREIIKNKNFFRLWVGQLVSQFGDRLNQMALIAFIFKRSPGSTFELAKLLGLTIIPVFLIGPLAGVYVDRWDRRRTMFVCDLIRAVLVFLIPFFFLNYDSLLPIYVIVFLTFSLSRFFVPAKMSIIPDLVKEKDLLMANSLVHTTGMIASALGLGVGGILVEFLGVKGGFYLDAGTFLISAVLIFFVSTKIKIRLRPTVVMRVGKQIAQVIRKSIKDELKDTLIFLKTKQKLQTILNILFMLWAALGSVYVVVIVFIQRVFHSVVKDLGLLAVFLGCGLFLGSLVYAKLGKKISYLKAIFISLVFTGLSLLAFTSMSYHFVSFHLTAALAFVLGMSISPIMIASNTLVHEVTHAEMRGKIFTTLEIVTHFAFLIFMFITASLAEHVGQFAILITAGISMCCMGIWGLMRRNDKTSRT